MMKIKILFTAILLAILFNTANSQTWTHHFGNQIFYEVDVDTNNTLWAASEFGLYKFDGAIWTQYNSNTPALSHLLNNDCNSVFVDNQSHIWAGFEYGDIIEFDGDSTWKAHEVPLSTIEAITQDQYGNIWVGGSGNRVYKYDGIRWTQQSYNTSTVFSLEFDASNNLWVGSIHGLHKYSHDSIWTTYNNGNSPLTDDWIESLKRGNNDDIWIGSRDGLFLFDGSNWTRYDSSIPGINDDSFDYIDIDKDSVMWLAKGSRYFTHNTNNTWTSHDIYTSPYYFLSTESVVVDYNGDKFIATQKGVIKYDNNGAGPREFLNIAPTSYLCNGSSIRLAVNIPNATSVWQDGSTNGSFMVTQPGTYWVTVNSNGQIYKDTVSIDSYPLYNFTDTFTICAGDSFTFHDGTVIYNLVNPVNHVNNFQSYNGCDSTVTSYINVLTVDTSVIVAGTLLSSNNSNSTYQWLDCNDDYAPIPTMTSQYYNATNDGSYAVEINSNGCIDTSACNPIILPTCTQNYLNQTHKIVTSDRTTSYGKFGFDIVMDGNYAVSSSIQYSSAYVLKKDGNNRWNETAILKHTDWLPNDRFGSSLGIDGDFIVVGAEYEDQDTIGSNTLTNSGSAYIFKRDTGESWVQTQKITPLVRTQMTRFGTGVAIQGNTIAVGATWECNDANGNNWLNISGAVYIYRLDTITEIWNQVQIVVASDRTANAFFGNTVALDGDFLIVGASKEDADAAGGNILNDAGAVYVYKYNGSSYVETQKLVASDRNQNDLFGHKIDIDNNSIVISAHWEDENDLGSDSLDNAGSAYIFERDTITGIWSEFDKISASDRTRNDNFGTSVSIKDNLLLIGSKYGGEDTSLPGVNLWPGRAYLYEKSTTSWQERQIVVSNDIYHHDGFGSAVALETNYALIGASEEDDDKYGVNTIISAGSVYGFDMCAPCLATSSFNWYPDSSAIYGIIVNNTASGNITSYFWDFGDGNSSSQPYPQHTYNNAGTYNLCLTVTDGNGCANSFCDTLSVFNKTGTLTINVVDPLVTELDEKITVLEDIWIYPNPTSKLLTIIINQLNINEISIVDITGKTLKTIMTDFGVVDVSNLTNGIYFIKIITDEGTITKKFVKQ